MKGTERFKRNENFLKLIFMLTEANLFVFLQQTKTSLIACPIYTYFHVIKRLWRPENTNKIALNR